jgi:hypothetical protein
MAFSGCRFTRVVIPASVTSIESAFISLAIAQVVFMGSTTGISNSSFLYAGNNLKTAYDANGAGTYTKYNVHNWTYAPGYEP